MGSRVKAVTKEKEKKKNVLTNLELVNQKKKIFATIWKTLKKDNKNKKKEFVRGTKGVSEELCKHN